MEPSEFTNPANTVWKWEQCMTEEDLAIWQENLHDTYTLTNPLYVLEREKLLIAIMTVSAMRNWIRDGKKPGVWEL